MSEKEPSTARAGSTESADTDTALTDPARSDDTAPAGSLRAQWWQALLWTAVGVLAGGIGVLGYAVLVADDRYPMSWEGMRDELRATPTSLVVVSAVSALATVTWVVLARRRWAAGRWTGFSRLRLLVPVIVVLLGAGVWSYLCWRYISFTRQRAGTAFPGDRLLLVTFVYGVLLLSVALVIVAAGRIRTLASLPRLRPWAATAACTGAISAAAAVALAAGAVVAVGGEHTRIDATTAAAVPAPPVPADPNRVAWRWSDGGNVDAVAAGAGVVVAARGIVALDGRTGVERWHYRRSDSSARTPVAVEGGNGVVASFSGRLHAFDAFTGQLWWREEAETADIPENDDWPLLAAGSTVIRIRHNPDAPEPEFVGRDARSGEFRWRYSLPSECGAWPDTTIATTVLVRVVGDDCPWDKSTVALDATTGQELWRTPPESALILSTIAANRTAAT